MPETITIENNVLTVFERNYWEKNKDYQTNKKAIQKSTEDLSDFFLLEGTSVKARKSDNKLKLVLIWNEEKAVIEMNNSLVVSVRCANTTNPCPTPKELNTLKQ